MDSFQPMCCITEENAAKTLQLRIDLIKVMTLIKSKLSRKVFAAFSSVYSGLQ